MRQIKWVKTPVLLQVELGYTPLLKQDFKLVLGNLRLNFKSSLCFESCTFNHNVPSLINCTLASGHTKSCADTFLPEYKTKSDSHHYLPFPEMLD